jgi:hypothetical protein
VSGFWLNRIIARYSASDGLSSVFCLIDSRAKGKNEEYIDKYRDVVKTNRRMSRNEKEPRIKWSSWDETFEMKVREKDGKDEEWIMISHTVKSYYEDVYGISLQYPFMPIVRIGNQGFFPVELLFQELARVPNANDPEKVNQVLRYHDAFAGSSRMDHICQIKEEASGSGANSLIEGLKAFSLSVDQQPRIMKAMRIAAPALRFDNATESNAHSGSWNLDGKVFKRFVHRDFVRIFLVSYLFADTLFLRSAELSSYAVVDLGQSRMMSSRELMLELFRTMGTHGMELVNHGERALQDITVSRGSSDVRPEHVSKLVRKDQTSNEPPRCCLIDFPISCTIFSPKLYRRRSVTSCFKISCFAPMWYF